MILAPRFTSQGYVMFLCHCVRVFSSSKAGHFPIVSRSQGSRVAWLASQCWPSLLDGWRQSWPCARINKVAKPGTPESHQKKKHHANGPANGQWLSIPVEKVEQRLSALSTHPGAGQVGSSQTQHWKERSGKRVWRLPRAGRNDSPDVASLRLKGETWALSRVVVFR